MPGTPSDPRRLIVFIAVVLAHTAVLVLLVKTSGGIPEQPRDAQPSMVWLLLPSAPERRSAPVPPARPVTPAGPRITPSAPQGTRAPDATARPEEAPPGGPLPPHGDLAAPVPPSIDWHSETASAAARQLALEAEKRRQSSAFAPPPTPSSLRDAPRAPQSGWDYAATHRIDKTPRGATYININDRCVYAFPILLVCRIGETAPNTHLFEHARDALSSEAN